MTKKDKGYDVENLMISFRALTPILLIICTGLIGYLVLKIDDNTYAVNKMNVNLSALVAEKENIKDRVARLESIFDNHYRIK